MAWATRAYLLGMLGHSILEVTVRAFYAQQDARTPLRIYWAAALFVVLGFGLAWLLRLGLPWRMPGFHRHCRHPARLAQPPLSGHRPAKDTLGRVILAGGGLGGAVVSWSCACRLSTWHPPADPAGSPGGVAMGRALCALPFIWPEIAARANVNQFGSDAGIGGKMKLAGKRIAYLLDEGSRTWSFTFR